MQHCNILVSEVKTMFKCFNVYFVSMLCGEGRVHMVYKVPCYSFFIFRTVFCSFSLEFFSSQIVFSGQIHYWWGLPITIQDESLRLSQLQGSNSWQSSPQYLQGHPCFSNWMKINGKISLADAIANKLNPRLYFLIIFLFISKSIFKHFCMGCELAATDCLFPKLIF